MKVDVLMFYNWFHENINVYFKNKLKKNEINLMLKRLMLENEPCKPDALWHIYGSVARRIVEQMCVKEQL